MATVFDVVPADFFVIFGLLVFVVVAAAGWSYERERSLRLLSATKELERIQILTAQALREHSDEKLQQVNELIGSWDQAYTEDVGEPVAKLQPNQAT